MLSLVYWRVQFGVKVSEHDRRYFCTRVESSKVVFERCFLFILPVSVRKGCLSCRVPLCLSCLSSLSKHGCTFPLISPNFCVREPFSSLYYVQKFLLLSLALGDALPIVPSSLPSGCSCKHTPASFKCEKWGFLPTCSVCLGKLHSFLSWEST